VSTQHSAPGGGPGALREVLFADGTTPTVPPASVARPVVVITAGRIEYTCRCTGCGRWHRHVSLGEKTAPCGAVYLLQPRRGGTA
jgi:hypothetical protein